MKIIKTSLLIFSIFLFGCKNPKEEPSKVKFDFSEMPKDFKSNSKTYVNDLEKLFTEKENQQLESLLQEIKKETGETVLLMTIPSIKTSNKDWKVGEALTGKQIVLTISKSSKEVNIGINKPITPEIEEVIKRQFLEFEKGKFYSGTKTILEEVIK